jgi:tetratricopeptide (TPR) repeat protein
VELVNDVAVKDWQRPAPAPGPASEKIFEDLALFPYDHSLIYQLAARLVKEKKYEKAEQVLKALLKKENCFEVLEAYGICLYHLGKWSECAHITRQALMLGEGFRDQRFELLKFQGNSLIQLRDFDGAQEAYEKAFALVPGSSILQVNFGTLWVQRADWNRATECFRYALFLEPENDRAWVGLALCHNVRGDFDLARANLFRALDVNPLNDTAVALLIDWTQNKADFLKVVESFTHFVDEGGFTKSISQAFVTKARDFGYAELAGWEEFHMGLRDDQLNV